MDQYGFHLTPTVCLQMTRYKHAELEDDASSVGSVQLAEGVSSTTTHIRYHPVSTHLLCLRAY